MGGAIVNDLKATGGAALGMLIALVAMVIILLA
jgi:hypothetical protein